MQRHVRSIRAGAWILALGLALAPLGVHAEPPHRVNVNTATAEELESLPGVGSARARAILEARKSRGGFKTVDELVEVKGIGPSGLEKLRPFVTIDGRAAVSARPGTSAD